MTLNKKQLECDNAPCVEGVMSKKKDKKGTGGVWFFYVLGVPFLFAGLFVIGLMFKNTGQSLMAKSWQETPARVLSATLDSSQSSEGGTTYRAKGSYEYEWHGQTYTSDRIFFGSTYDSNRDFHNDAVWTLKSAKKSSETIVVKVNPKNPEQAVAFPAIRWGQTIFMSLFGLLFASVGAGVLWLAQYSRKSIIRENKREQLYPNEPWRWKDEWQTPEVKSNSKAGFYTSLVFAAFWNMISWPILIVIWKDLVSMENPIILIVLLFPIVGIFLGQWAFKSYKQWQYFGNSTFALDTYPAALGHALSGRLRVSSTPPSDTEFLVQLACIRRTQTGSGDNRRTVETILWEDQQSIPAHVGSQRDMFELPIHFELPADVEPSSVEDGYPDILWRLNVDAEAGRIDFDQNFEVPVFDPSEYAVDVPDMAYNQAEASKVYTYEGDWQKTGVVHTDNPDGGYYYFPPARHKTIGLVTLVLVSLQPDVAVKVSR